MKTKIFNDLIKQADELGLKKITSIDLSDRTDIILNYNGKKIKIYIGSSVDMDYKLKYIKAVIDEKLSDNFKGTLRYNGVNSGISAILITIRQRRLKMILRQKRQQMKMKIQMKAQLEVSDLGYTEPEQSVDENGDYNGWQ